METYHHWQVWTCYVHVDYLWSHEPITPYLGKKTRLQNSPYFCVFKYARAVKQKVWNEAENRERDWVFSLSPHTRLARFARIRLLRHALPISLLILRKKPTVLQSRKKTWKWKKTPTKTTKLPIILNNFKLCPFNLEIVKNGWKETCVWFTLKLEFFFTLFFKIFRVLGKLKRIHIRIHPPRPWFLQAERYANGNPS